MSLLSPCGHCLVKHLNERSSASSSFLQETGSTALLKLKYMKHIAFTTTLFTLSLGSFSYLQADVTDAQMRSLENRVSAMEQKKGSNAMVNPPGRPQVRDGADLFFTADWLIWQGQENGNGYAIKTKKVQSETTALYNSSVKNLHFDWDSGFRVGLGYNLPHDGWDLVAGWTWFQNTAKGHTSSGSGAVFSANPYDLAEQSVDYFSSSYAHLNLKLNMIDLDLGREFFVSKWMTIRPFMGLRTTWVNQRFNANYNDPIPASSVASFSSKATNKYWGIGIHSGMNTQWGLGAGFSLYGNAAFSILNGFFKVKDYEATQYTNGTHNDNIGNIDSFRVGRVISELAMGLRWDTMFADDRCHFGIQGGWEQLMFFGQNQFKHFYGSFISNAGAYFANQGDLTFQGWTLAARLDF